MKTTLRVASRISAFAFGLAVLAQYSGLVSFPRHSSVLVGGLVVSGLLVFAFGDYARKPSFRVRRTSGGSIDAGPTVNRPVGPGPDWTYATRSR